MILTCPSCSARYLLATDAIGENGRPVRCGKCHHVWEQEPVRDSLDDLNAVDFVERPDPDPEDDIPSGVQPLRDFPAYQPAEPPPPSPMVQMVQRNLPLITGVTMAVAVFAVLALIVISARGMIIEALPSTQPLFIALGFEEGASEKTLVFDSVVAKITKDELTVTGSLINLSSKLIILPPLAVELLDSSGKVVTSYTANMTAKDLKGEESVDLSFSFKDVPADAEHVRLKFQGEEAEAPTTDAADADNTPAHSEGGSDHPTAHE